MVPDATMSMPDTMHKRHVLITGACGFIGHHIVQHFLNNTDHEIYIIDKLSYASYGLDRLRNIESLENPRMHLYIYDLNSKIDVGFAKELSKIEWILHLAAETHVDNSINDPHYVISNNIHSTLNLLEFVRTAAPRVKKFLYFSTDEVYGPAMESSKDFTESSRHNPTNPYSASKSASEMICLSYRNTFGIPLLICNAPNVFGQRQHCEKFIPTCIRKLLKKESIPIHCYPGTRISGSRFYVHASDVAAAVQFLMDHVEANGESYNIAGSKEVTNEDVCDKIAGLLGIKDYEKMYMDDDPRRPNHDIRYGLDASKLSCMMAEMGQSNNNKTFEEQLAEVVAFTMKNHAWI